VIWVIGGFTYGIREPAYGMREPAYGMREPAYCMRFPHTVCGHRIQYAVTAFVYVDMGAGPVHTYNAK